MGLLDHTADIQQDVGSYSFGIEHLFEIRILVKCLLHAHSLEHIIHRDIVIKGKCRSHGIYLGARPAGIEFLKCIIIKTCDIVIYRNAAVIGKDRHERVLIAFVIL